MDLGHCGGKAGVSASIGMAIGQSHGLNEGEMDRGGIMEKRVSKNISEHTPPSLNDLVTLRILMERKRAHCASSFP